ncbi:FAD/NAD(P)-binding domain-containing protein [Xylariaceae sp. FL1019]|nr:FAD/NAD(P)-binding domain-containing protein [Xylariaceae sp. FL1019]
MEALLDSRLSKLPEIFNGDAPSSREHLPGSSATEDGESNFGPVFFPQYPFIVVGSGMGGGMLVRQLMSGASQLQPKVVLVEKGGITFPTHCLNTSRTHFDHRSQGGRGRDNEVMFDNYLASNSTQYKVRRPKEESCGGGSAFELGGRSLFWSLETPPIRSDRLNKFFPAEVAADLLNDKEPRYADAQRILANGPPGDVAYPQEYVSRATLGQVSEAKIKLAQALKSISIYSSPIESTPNGAEFADANNLYYFPQGAYSTADWIQDKLMNQPSQDISPLATLLRAPVKGVGVREGKVVKINVNGHWFAIGAHQTVILCAGTVDTAGIALRSWGLPSGVSESIGKKLTDHEIWMNRYWKRISLDEYKKQKAIELSCYVTIHGHEALLTICLHAEKFYGHGFADGKGGSDAYAERVNVLNIMLEFEAELNDEGRVTLDESKNPQIDMNRKPLDSSDAFKQEVKKLCKAIREEFGFVPGKGAGQYDDDQVRLAPWGSVAHEVGTMRMDGPGRSDGVVDENLKVKGVENLFVCDLSVFPVSPMENPSLTMTALAMRLGDHLLGRGGR